MVAKLIMRYIKHFPFEVENFWVPLSDGICLAGRRWQPKDRAKYPLPTIFQLVLESSESWPRCISTGRDPKLDELSTGKSRIELYDNQPQLACRSSRMRQAGNNVSWSYRRAG